MIKFMDLGNQYKLIKDRLDLKLNEIIHKSAFIGGEEVRCFEQEFASYCGANFCIGLANGTDALEIALETLQLPKNSVVLVPANSFIASAEAVTRTGLKVKFIPFNEQTFVIDKDIVLKNLDENVSAIIVVHLYGRPVNINSFRGILHERNIKIIEDCAQAHGAKFEGESVGTMGDIGCFSFYPGKNLGAFGDAGAITTNDQLIADRVRRLANHGRLEKFDHDIVGRNSRLDNLQAAVLRIKLEHLDLWNQKRNENANTYFNFLKPNNALIVPTIVEGEHHVYHHFVIRTTRRDELKHFLLQKGVETGIHYPKIIPRFNAYIGADYDGPSNGDELISLPVAEHLGSEEIAKISELINSFNLETN
jgi:dTDP-4-amino-4,6-dideoxygalactose transaminase